MGKTRVVVLLVSLAGFAIGCSPEQQPTGPEFHRMVLFAGESKDEPWAKFTGDLDREGAMALYVGFRDSGEIVELRFDRPPRVVTTGLPPILTDGGIADLDGDGSNEIVVLTQDGVYVSSGPGLAVERISPGRYHDLRFLDEDGDGQLEIVARDQTAFADGSGEVHILTRRGSGEWVARIIGTVDGEGLAVADVDGDGDPDIIVAPNWLENGDGRDWISHAYAADWDWPHAKIAVSDLNGDGARDIVLAPAELVGQRFKISWFRSGDAFDSLWAGTTIRDDVEAVVHSLQLGDIDRDGDTDVVYAEMHQGDDPDRVVFVENVDDATAWREHEIDRIGSHNLQLVDWDGDGDLDLAGANWAGDNQDVVLWRNSTCDAPWTAWRRHVIDSDRPGQAAFVFAADLNGDSHVDVVSGSRAYLNPGPDRPDWRIVSLGTAQADAVGVWDLDADGAPDVLVLEKDPVKARFRWLRNDGLGAFASIDPGVEASGDFLQGIARLNRDDTASELVLSWHEPGLGVELLRIPPGAGDAWSTSRISDISQDEDVSIGDIDDDGDPDILLGTRWLRSENGQWTVQSIEEGTEAPDRNEIADLDGDGDLDLVVGFEAISRAGDVVWFEARNGAWVRHAIATVVGPMSLDIADMDKDGDPDVIVGEHNLENPGKARLWIFENINGRASRWTGHVVYTGDEHHDGARVADLDSDGDLDIVSIGWGHQDVIWYENRMPLCRADGQAGERQVVPE